VASPRIVLMAAAGGRPEPLERELVERARRWADELAPGSVFSALGGVAEAVAGLFSGGGGPVVVIWPELVRWRPDHATGALDDLADDCELSVGPMFDGGFYLVAFARPVPSLLDLPMTPGRPAIQSASPPTPRSARAGVSACCAPSAACARSPTSAPCSPIRWSTTSYEDFSVSLL
jgi:hypothetical protein